ncbi:(S)-2,3-di-O-geranylgeranylglyceryl phosphate synthase [Pirellula sp. SH-Sr6A]|uniref:UbiA family prenyltransferase n=1 Tax=Pirellula sp. SH-Sr6A TaxID=1632865 RepID=UPI00078C3BA2|nr:UbiA family prenyltransferase [Pirellula sp. SH-Sr6A]AMV33037.1 (S)-2,3-di-O-geranylgeranylglyceryl phosphate synthase [Pirellula sp. SH-Sr6A]
MVRFRDWAQLVRIPNTLTACADALAGFSIVAGVWHIADAPRLLLISLASIALYWSGMVLNDVNDIAKDKQEGRKGPLVDDRISWGTARHAGWGLLIGGVLLATASGFATTGWTEEKSLHSEPWRGFYPAVGSILLAICIVLYDSPLKSTFIGPWIMGLCRACNLMTGMALGCTVVPATSAALSSLGHAAWMLPLGHGLFVVGLTLAARKEAKLFQSKPLLAASWSLSVLGLAILALAPLQVDARTFLRLEPATGFPILIALLAAPWFLRAVRSVRAGTVPSLVAAIKQAILTILFLDAAITLQFAGNTAGLLVCFLAIPTFALGRWFRMT